MSLRFLLYSQSLVQSPTHYGSSVISVEQTGSHDFTEREDNNRIASNGSSYDQLEPGRLGKVQTRTREYSILIVSVSKLLLSSVSLLTSYLSFHHDEEKSSCNCNRSNINITIAC